MTVRTSEPRGRFRLRRPVLYLLAAVALGPVYAWAIVCTAWSLSWTREWAVMAFTGDPWKHVLPFALTSVALAWTFRKWIANGTVFTAAWLTSLCALFGGPVYAFFAQVESVVRVPSQLENPMVVLLLPLTSLAGLLGMAFLPVTMPLSFAAILVLRWTSGGLAHEVTEHGSVARA